MSSAIHRVVAAAATASLLLVPTAGSAETGGATARHLATVDYRVSADGVAARSSLDRHGAALERFDPRDPTSLLHVSRVLSGVPTAGMSGSSPDQPAADSHDGGTEEDAEETYRYLDVVGDLDGDGGADTLVSTYRYPSGTATVEARRGTDGTVLWTRDGGDGAFGQDVGDVDGDGHDDLLLIGQVVHGSTSDLSCDDEGCGESGSSTFTTTYGIADGRSGQPLWTESLDGSYRYDVRYEGAMYREEVQGTNVFVGVQPTSGPAGVRLLLSAHDVDRQARSTRTDATEVGGVRLGLITEDDARSAVRTSTRAAVLDVTDGTELLRRSTEDVQGFASLSAAGQLVGDRVEDVLWITDERTDRQTTCTTTVTIRECQGEESTDALVVEGIDGADLSTTWTTRMAELPFAFGFPLGADVDGDGSGEVLVLGIGDGDERRFTTTLLSGTTGAVTWTVDDDDWLFPVAVDDVDGDGDEDLLTALFTFDTATGEDRLDLRRVDGSTGDTLFTTTAPTAPTVEGNCTFEFGYVGGLEDVDGDGVAELHGGSVAQGFEDCTERVDAASVLWGESGATGSPLYQQAVDGLRVAFPTGDLDGDAVVDLLVEDGGTGQLTAVSLPTLAPLWAVEVGDASTSTIGDLDGDGVSDLLVSAAVEEAERLEYQLWVRSGTDGHAVWGVPGS